MSGRAMSACLHRGWLCVKEAKALSQTPPTTACGCWMRKVGGRRMVKRGVDYKVEKVIIERGMWNKKV